MYHVFINWLLFFSVMWSAACNFRDGDDGVCDSSFFRKCRRVCKRTWNLRKVRVSPASPPTTPNDIVYRYTLLIWLLWTDTVWTLFCYHFNLRNSFSSLQRLSCVKKQKRLAISHYPVTIVRVYHLFVLTIHQTWRLAF